MAALLMLGLGIGVNVGMFEIVDRLLLRPPPFLRNPEAVHRVYATRVVRGEPVFDAAFSYPALGELSQSAATVDIVAAHFTRELVVGTADAARPRPVTHASASFWSLFDAPPALGRYFSASDDRLPAGSAVAVLGHAFWRRSRQPARRRLLSSTASARR